MKMFAIMCRFAGSLMLVLAVVAAGDALDAIRWTLLAIVFMLIALDINVREQSR